tara:strand:- start:31 stop:204 length:174 start_codon:yes stop_codon:yes gene_type:complete
MFVIVFVKLRGRLKSDHTKRHLSSGTWDAHPRVKEWRGSEAFLSAVQGLNKPDYTAT